MFIKRVSVAGASLVCRVENTICPVCAALIAISRRFEIANFTDHDDIWILPQECLERDREGQSGAVVDVDLVHAGQIDFGRIFSSRMLMPG